MAFLQNTAILIPVIAASLYGGVKVASMNFYPSIDSTLNHNTLYGILILLHTMFGINPISEAPQILRRFTSSTWFKLVSLFVISFSATRDFEDAILVLVTFLGLVQLMRTKEERKKYPYIIA